MDCIICKSELKKGQVNHIVDMDNHIIIIKNVPALICEQCGEYYIGNDVAIRLEMIIDDVIKNKAEILVLNYTEMVA